MQHIYMRLLAEIALIIFFAFLFLYIAKNLRYKLFTKLIRGSARNSTYYIYSKLLKVGMQPLQFCIWAIVLSSVIEILYQHVQIHILRIVDLPIRATTIILSISWFLIRWINVLENPTLVKHKKHITKKDKITTDVRSKILKILIFIIGGLLLLDTFGININAIVALGGVGGIAVGFASQGLLSNFFGTLMIYLDKSFKIDDTIRILSNNIEGTVEKINWRCTEIRTMDKKLLHVPNAIFSTATVENASKIYHHRIQEKFEIKYQDYKKLLAVIDDIKLTLTTNICIDQSLDIIVNANEISQDTLILLVDCFTHKQNWLGYNNIKQDIIIKILDILEKNNIELNGCVKYR